MRNILLAIEYEGTNFNGWQIQDGKRTIQGEIEKVLSQILNDDTKIFGAGRTDSGVHALEQCANFKTVSNIPVYNIKKALNSYLPQDIIIKEAIDVKPEFDARKSAKGKRYRYIVSQTRSALQRNQSWLIEEILNIEKMKEASQYLIGIHDFASFMASGSNKTNTIRELHKVEIVQIKDKIIFDFNGNGFLYNMVRIIVAMLIEVGLERIKPLKIKEILESKIRNNAPKTAPAHGLYLVEIYY